MVDQFRILCWKFPWLTKHWGSRNTLIQSTVILIRYKYNFALKCNSNNSALKWRRAWKEIFRTLSSYFWLNDVNLRAQKWQVFIFLLFTIFTFPFERDNIFKESLFDCLYQNKLWNRLPWKVFWKNTEMYPGQSRQLRWRALCDTS